MTYLQRFSRRLAPHWAPIPGSNEIRNSVVRSDGITPLAISPRQRLDDAVRMVSNLPFGGTDCALPMLYALAYDRERTCS